MPRSIRTLIATLKPQPTSFHKFSQDTWLAGRTFGKKGVCAPLCGLWTRMRGAGEGPQFKHYVNSEAGREDVMYLKEQQLKNSKKYMEDYLSAFGMTSLGTKVVPRMQTETALAEARKPGYFIFGISTLGTSPPPLGGHAIAVDGNTNHVFDPNFGQFKCATATAVQDLLFGLVTEYYEDMKFGATVVYHLRKA